MAGRRTADSMGDDSLLSEDAGIDESLWTSPIKSDNSVRNAALSRSGQTHVRSNITTDGTHEDNLRRELASVRRVNEAMESVLESLEKAKTNMKSVTQTVGAASSLLNIWTRILSQTEHNQRLILDPSWQGVSQDIADMEDEAVAKQEAAERREAEEQERKAAAARKAEEDERRQVEAANASSLRPKPSTRGRPGTGRGTGSARAGYTASTSASTSTSSISRGTGSGRGRASGIGRATRSTRGRG